VPQLSPRRTRLLALGPLADAVLGTLLLLAAGGAVGLALGTRLWPAEGADFLLRNRAPDAVRDRILLTALAAALALAAAPVGGWLAGRSSGTRLREIAARLSPLLPLGLAGLMFDEYRWSEARLVHLVLCALVAWLSQLCLRASLLAAPLDLERRLRERALGSAIARILRATANRPALPAALVIAAAAAYAAWFAHITLEAHWNGYTRSYDLAIFDNLFWNAAHGGDFLRSTPAGGGETSHFGRHATLLVHLLVPIYALHESAATLLVLQSLLIGFAAVPLFLFARRHLEPWLACGIALAYLLYAPLHGSNLYDFHFLSLSPFFVFCLAHALETRSRAWLALAVTLTLLCREDVALAVAVLGAYHVLAGRRARVGALLVIVGGAWFAAMKFVLMPLAAAGASYAEIYQGLLPEGETGFAGVLRTLLSNPAFVLSTLLQEEKLEYALLVLAPLAFVPLRRPLGALFLAPGVLFTLLSTEYPLALSIGFQYTAFWSPYVFVAATLLLRSDSFEPRGAPAAGAARAGWLFAFGLSTLLCSYQYGAVFQQSTAAGGFQQPFPFQTGALDLARRRLRDEVLASLPPAATVAASEGVAPHVSNRATAYTLREGVRDAEYVLFGLPPEAQGEHAFVRPLLVSGRFGVVAMNSSYALIQRGAPTRLNARLVPRLRLPAPAAAAP